MKKEEIKRIKKEFEGKPSQKIIVEVYFPESVLKGKLDIYDAFTSKIYINLDSGPHHPIALKNDNNIVKIVINQKTVYKAGRIKKLRWIIKKKWCSSE